MACLLSRDIDMAVVSAVLGSTLVAGALTRFGRLQWPTTALTTGLVRVVAGVMPTGVRVSSVVGTVAVSRWCARSAGWAWWGATGLASLWLELGGLVDEFSTSGTVCMGGVAGVGSGWWGGGFVLVGRY